jgi:hypothetical protein
MYMSVVVVQKPITAEELIFAKQDYGEYIKIVVDIEIGILAAGGEWHSDAEKVLLDSGSKQENLWGGGIDLTTGEVDYVSLINTRPKLNNSQEVSDPDIRLKMLLIIKKYLAEYVSTR